jgi:hypothetical protein
MSLIENSSIFRLYIFNGSEKMEIKDINCENLSFYHRSNLYGVFEEDFLPFESPFSLQLINTNSPTSLSQSAKKRKCYIAKNQIVITIDTDIDFTQKISINLKSFELTEKIYKKTPNKYFETNEVNSNSFLIDDFLFQIKTSSSKATFSMKDLNNNLIKEYEILNDKPIDFKNSDFFQENGCNQDKRTLYENKQFTRKINNLNVGLSLYKTNNLYHTTIGSVSEIKQNNGIIYGGMFGLVGVLMYYALSNPTLENFNSYSNRKVVYFNSLLELNGSHNEGGLKPLAFDKIKNYLLIYPNLSSQTIFKVGNTYYLGFFEKKSVEYSIRKFVD